MTLTVSKIEHYRQIFRRLSYKADQLAELDEMCDLAIKALKPKRRKKKRDTRFDYD